MRDINVTFEPGKLYKCSKYYLYVYPTKRKAMTVLAVSETNQVCIDYWSKHLNCKVCCSKPGDIFMVLEQPEDEYTHVLFGDKQGWIILRDYHKIEIVK